MKALRKGQILLRKLQPKKLAQENIQVKETFSNALLFMPHEGICILKHIHVVWTVNKINEIL